MASRDAPAPTTEPDRWRAAFATAAARDADVARAFIEMLACLTLPHEIFARPEFVKRVQTVAAEYEPPMAVGPSREQLAALIA